MNQYLAAITKLLLEPRTTTIYDLEKIVEAAKIRHKDDLEKTENQDEIVTLARLALKTIEPIIIVKPSRISVEKTNLERWFRTMSNIYKVLRKTENDSNVLQLFANSVIMQYLFLVSLYPMLNLSRAGKNAFIRGKFSEDAFEFLIELKTSGTLVKTFDSTQIKIFIELAFQYFLYHLKYALKTAGGDATIPATIQKILEANLWSPKKIITFLEQINIEGYPLQIADVIFFILEILTREEIPSEQTKNLALRLQKFIKNHKSRQIIKEISLQILNMLAETNQADMTAFLHKLGDYLRKLRKTEASMIFSDVYIRIPADFRSIPIGPVIHPINLSDFHIAVSPDYIINDTLQIIQIPLLHLREILSSLIINKNPEDILNSILDDPLASLALSNIIGSISAWLIDRAVRAQMEQNDELAEKIVSLTVNYLKNTMEKTEKLLNIFDNDHYRRYIAYFLLKEYYLASLRLTSDTITRLRRLPSGRSIVRLMSKISRLIEEIYSIGPKEKHKMDFEDFSIA